ncbi:hypothetical protein SMA5143A_7183 [Streptomyces sp. MA5143a]|nr:hypothetical protein SMA5143A_7183 [Streptomyces sp. MA5143a]
MPPSACTSPAETTAGRRTKAERPAEDQQSRRQGARSSGVSKAVLAMARRASDQTASTGFGSGAYGGRRTVVSQSCSAREVIGQARGPGPRSLAGASRACLTALPAPPLVWCRRGGGARAAALPRRGPPHRGRRARRGGGWRGSARGSRTRRRRPRRVLVPAAGPRDVVQLERGIRHGPRPHPDTRRPVGPPVPCGYRLRRPRDPGSARAAARSTAPGAAHDGSLPPRQLSCDIKP